MSAIRLGGVSFGLRSIGESDHAGVLRDAGLARWFGLAHARLGTAGDGHLARAHDLLDTHRAQQLEQGLDLALLTGRLQDECGRRYAARLGPERGAPPA